MPQTFDRVDLACTDVDASQWPKLSCGGANQLRLEAGSLRLEGNRELFFEDNGQIRSFDDSHKLVFDRVGNRLELHEAGDIRFFTGAPTPTEKLRIRADGNVSIATDASDAKLHVGGNIHSDGALSVTSDATISGALRVHGGATLDNSLTVQGDLQVSNVLNAREIRQANTPLVSSQWTTVVGGITYLGGNVGIGTETPETRLDIYTPGAGGAHILAGSHVLTLRGVNDPAAYRPVLPYIQWREANDTRAMYLGWGRTTAPKRIDLGLENGYNLSITGGNVGIGTTTPTLGLDVRGEAQGWIGSGDSSQSVGGWRLGRWPAYAPNTWLYLSRVDSQAYQDLAIGALWAGGALRFGTADDLAEMTPVRPTDRLEPGDVVTIDEPADDRVLLTKSTIPYDLKVAGVISDPTQAGLVIGGSHPTDITRDDVKPIALTGRVLTKVTTENGPIKAGDLLTTAATGGHAMRATQPGPILGKAMQSFPGHQGEVTRGKIWVHVNLAWYGAPGNSMEEEGETYATNR